jgi:predicted dehydrogenase
MTGKTKPEYHADKAVRASVATPVPFAMVGGGEGAFIGEVHRWAAALAGNCRLVSGAFSSDPDRSLRSGAAIGLAAERVYPDWRTMIAEEAGRIGFVAIVTPNHLHAAPAIAALEAGLPVLCDKPLAGTLADATAIAAAATRTGGLVGVTHAYAGYPMVEQMGAMVRDGVVGAIRRVAVSYTQDWLSRAGDAEASAQAAWRTDPARSGDTGALGDIGSHAAHLVEHVTGERIAVVAADLRAAVAGRLLDDDGAALFRLSGGGRGTLVASQVATGDINQLDLSIYGEEAALHWRQEDPNRLTVKRRDRPAELWTAGAGVPYLASAARTAARTPAGHPEGYIEAFANIYRSFAEAVASGAPTDRRGFGTLEEAMRTMRFLAAAKASSDAGAVWTKVGER